MHLEIEMKIQLQVMFISGLRVVGGGNEMGGVLGVS